MSFVPVDGAFESSLFGVGANEQFIETSEHNAHADSIVRETKNKKNTNTTSTTTNNVKYTISVVIISALVFITLVAIYDVIRNIINNYYAEKSLKDPNSHNTQEEIDRTTIANNNQLTASIIFALFCIITAVIIIIILVKNLK